MTTLVACKVEYEWPINKGDVRIISRKTARERKRSGGVSEQ